MYVRYVWVSWGCLIEPSEFCSDTDPDAAALTFEGGCLSEWCGDDALMLAYICIIFICQTETQLLRGWGTGCAQRSWRVNHIWASANPKDSACSTFFVSCTASCNLKSLSGSILHQKLPKSSSTSGLKSVYSDAIFEFLSEARNPEFGMCNRNINQTLCGRIAF